MFNKHYTITQNIEYRHGQEYDESHLKINEKYIIKNNLWQFQSNSFELLRMLKAKSDLSDLLA